MAVSKHYSEQYQWWYFYDDENGQTWWMDQPPEPEGPPPGAGRNVEDAGAAEKKPQIKYTFLTTTPEWNIFWMLVFPYHYAVSVMRTGRFRPADPSFYIVLTVIWTVLAAFAYGSDGGALLVTISLFYTPLACVAVMFGACLPVWVFRHLHPKTFHPYEPKLAMLFVGLTAFAGINILRWFIFGLPFLSPPLF